MEKVKTKRIVMNGLMIALVFLVTFFTKIPGPVGPFNIGDAVIMVTAIILGRNSGMLAGALGSAAADIAMGYAVFSPFTLVIKGLEGYIVGSIAYQGKSEKAEAGRMIVGVVAGAIIMIAGYFFSEFLILPIFDKNFGLVMAINDLVYTNLIQGGVSAVVGYVLSTLLIKANVMKRITI
ncbi:MAG: ECF transporter S component [Ruminiclostridium sp.]|nr:ECF transporter S component [Ruminiclostridium sp.]